MVKRGNTTVIVGGALIGLIAAVLVKLGNPANMGFCIACFYRDIAGGLGLQTADKLQYVRPEILGLIIGGSITALAGGNFHSRGGSSTALRFFLGFFMVIGALVFLGCPLRMILRLAGGDLNAIAGVLGFTSGVILAAQFFLKKGFSLGRCYRQKAVAGWVFPAMTLVLLILVVAQSGWLKSNAKHAPVIVSILAGLMVGAIAQRTRICTAGSIRDAFLIKDYTLLWAVLAIFTGAVLGNLVFNAETVHIGFAGQNAAHTDGLWNFLGMFLVGICAVMLGGCPLRQTILASEGDNDAVATVFGMVFGGAAAHNFGTAASAKGVPLNGKLLVVAGIVFAIAVALVVIHENRRNA
ncbi:MAG: YedE family putative selenium transporter [Sphaerochaetaceae bacterium]